MVNLHLGDCMEAMAKMHNNAFELAIVDPPYGLNLALNGQFAKYGGSSKWDYRPEPEYFQELFRVSKNQIIWGWNYLADMLTSCKGFIYWNKLNHHDNRSDGEVAWTSFDKLARHFEYMWDGNRYGTKGNIQGVGKPSIRIHPTQKPVALYKWLLHNYANEGDKILDTHLGSASIAIACHDMGFDLEAWEIDPEYYAKGVERFNRHKAQLKLF
jgi:site-specific DNA-methyltransferase (adenine-specific)